VRLHFTHHTWYGAGVKFELSLFFACLSRWAFLAGRATN